MPNPIFADAVRETTTTTGTGAVTLAGAAPGGYFTFASAYGDGDQLNYVITDNVSAREVGRGTYVLASNSVTRDKVYSSTSAGALVSFGAGSKDIWVDVPARKVVSAGFSPNKILDGEHVVIPDDQNLVAFHRLALQGASRVYALGTSRVAVIL